MPISQVPRTRRTNRMPLFRPGRKICAGRGMWGSTGAPCGMRRHVCKDRRGRPANKPADGAVMAARRFVIAGQGGRWMRPHRDRQAVDRLHSPANPVALGRAPPINPRPGPQRSWRRRIPIGWLTSASAKSRRSLGIAPPRRRHSLGRGKSRSAAIRRNAPCGERFDRYIAPASGRARALAGRRPRAEPTGAGLPPSAPPSPRRTRDFGCGEMAEWSKAHAWKVCRRVTVSRVRIPFSPPSTPLRH